MNKIFIALVAIPAVMLASDASAQPGYGMRGDMGIGVQLDNLDARLDAGVQAGAIDRGEQRRLRYQMRDLRQLEARYAANGIDQRERADLRQRLRTLRQEVRRAGGSRWGERYGWDDNDWDRGRDGTYGRGAYPTDRYGNPVAGGYDDRRDRYDDRDGVRGRGLNVGDIVTGALGGRLNSASGVGYRDRRDVYFRSDGRRVYEINARTNRVVRIHPIR